MTLFPLFADLQGRRTLVVGGGAVASRKAQSLLQAGALVTVGAPELDPALARLAAEGRLTHLRGGFEPAWLDGAWLVIAATDDRAVNAAVNAAAQALQVFCNVVDDPQLSSFQVPSIVDRSPLVVAISSSGVAPVLARRLRERIETLLRGAGHADALAMRAAVPREGLATRLPWRQGTLRDLARDVVTIARDGLVGRSRRDATGQDEAVWLNPLNDIVAGGPTQAEHWLGRYNTVWMGDLRQIFAEAAI